MTSIFFKQNIAHGYCNNVDGRVGYKSLACSYVLDIYYIYKHYGDGDPNADLMLSIICNYGNQQCVDRFIETHPSFRYWGYGIQGACIGGHVQLVQQMYNYNQRGVRCDLAAIASRCANTLPVLLLMEKLISRESSRVYDDGLNYRFVVNYKDIAYRAIKRDDLELLRHALDMIKRKHTHNLVDYLRMVTDMISAYKETGDNIEVARSIMEFLSSLAVELIDTVQYEF